jgi:FkbM family methyltransferase
MLSMADTIAVDTIFGRIESFVDDLITDQILQFGAHTRPELALLLSVIEPGDFIFDVGAHIGSFAAPIAGRIGPTGKVLAVEALPINFDVLIRNVATLGLHDRVYPVCATIGSPGIAYRPQFAPRNTGATFLVQSSAESRSSTRTLDDLAVETFFPRVIKLDIEGLERVALQGAGEILSHLPILYIEINNDALIRYGNTIDELDDFLSNRGYKFFRNVGDRNAAHDNYVMREIDRLIDGGPFYDLLAIHVTDLRIKKKFDESRNLSAAEYKTLFDNNICDLPTHLYLRNPRLVAYLDHIIAPRAEAEAIVAQDRLQLGAEAHPHLSGARIALCNVALDNYAGSELWVSDIAKYLKTSGIDLIVYSPHCGKVAADLRMAQVRVTSSIDDVASFGPSLVHINHFESAKPLIERLKKSAVVFNMIHGLLPRPGLPGYSSVDCYGSVSIHSKAKIHALTETDWDEILTLPNFFDERRFTQISSLPGSRKALIFSSRTPPEFRERLRTLLTPLDFTLDHVGYGGTVSPEPEQVLPQYDLIFAVGRSAIESLASGAHVILWDFGVIGPAVTPENYWQCVATNFDLASNTLPWTFIEDPEGSGWLRDQVLKIGATSRRQTTQLTRTYLPLSAAGARLIGAYNDILRRFGRDRIGSGGGGLWLGRLWAATFPARAGTAELRK